MPNSAPYERFRYLQVTMHDSIALVAMLDPVDEHFLTQAHPMHTELRDIFPALAADPSVAAAILTGTGDRFFAGPGVEDTEALLTSSFAAGAKQMLEARQICNQMLEFSKPLVAALNGSAIGMGCQLAFLCDFAIGAKGIRIQDTHVRLGLPAGDGGTMMWPMLVGMARARSMLLRAHPIMADEAKELGLLADVVDAERLNEASIALARKLIQLPRFAYSATKLALNQWMRMGAMFSSDMAMGLELAAFAGPEFRTAISAASGMPKDRPPTP